jgi:hypothetical protein
MRLDRVKEIGMIETSIEEALRLIKAFRVIQNEESRRKIIEIAEAEASAAALNVSLNSMPLPASE